MAAKANDFVVMADGRAGIYDGKVIRLANGEEVPAEEASFILRYDPEGITIQDTDPEGITFPEMSVGSCGLVVCLIQQALKCRAYPCDVDGVFGPKTHAALREFMRDNYLTGDTVATAEVYKKLFADD